jgi:hypothetical protein
VKRSAQNVKYIPAPTPTVNPWKTNIASLRSAGEVMDQTTSPGTSTINTFIDQGTLDNRRKFLQIREELEKSINLDSLLKTLKSINERIAKKSSQDEKLSAFMTIP